MTKVAVIGSGTMGNGIAHVMAQYGHDVALIDVNKAALERARATIESNLARQVKKGIIEAADPARILGRITMAGEVPAAKGAALVIEAASEMPRVKFEIFAALDELLDDDAILASNTSSISITEIAAHTKRPDRVIGMHFMNPVPVMKLVEVINGHATSAATTRTIVDFASSLDKIPVEVSDYPGFVSNRVLMPMINEAIYCVFEGVAEPKAIDTVMELGMAHKMGPLALADFIGLDVCLAILQVMHTGLGDDKYRACPLLKRMVAAGDLGRKTGKGFFSYG